MVALDPTVFDDAVKEIKKNGWSDWSGGDVFDERRVCLWVAVHNVLYDRTLSTVTNDITKNYQNHIAVHLGVTDLQGVFDLNDAYGSDRKAGKKWAIGVLTEIAEKLRAH